MNEAARSSAVALNLDYEYLADAGRDLHGYVRTLQEAQQACADASGAPLDWTADGRAAWTASDPRTGITYVIERLPF
ncbi:hypothetical protein [Deinococcus sonorensis]|uniref:Uncharacterized protein n=1 Tax=Deinococcus sonorensis TaxID=309891 RepID=A0ABV8YBD2_9DEIO